MARLDTKQVAERLGVSYVVAAGLVKYLLDAGQASLVEKRKHDSGLGKPTRIYEIADAVTLNLATVVESVSVDTDTTSTDVSEAA